MLFAQFILLVRVAQFILLVRVHVLGSRRSIGGTDWFWDLGVVAGGRLFAGGGGGVGWVFGAS